MFARGCASQSPPYAQEDFSSLENVAKNIFDSFLTWFNEFGDKVRQQAEAAFNTAKDAFNEAVGHITALQEQIDVAVARASA